MNPKNTRAATLSTSVTSGAQANGITINTVTGILTNGQAYISDSPITFSISPASSATFVDGTTSQTKTTDTLGEATVDLVDNTAETVTVTLNASAYSATARASTTFTADGNSDLFPPFIDQVLNQTVELDLLPQQVTVSAEGNFLARQELVLRLYGNDASGVTVPDTTYSHMFPEDTKRVAFDVDIEVLRKYGGTDVHPHDSGQLDIIYTLDGRQSPPSSYNVYGPGGMDAHNYVLTGQAVQDSAPADGVSGCVVYWQVQENGASVSGLKATLSVDGSAGFELASGSRAESGEVTLPALVSYTDSRAERVTAAAVLVGYPAVSASEQLAFTAVNTYQVHAKIEQNNAAANGSAVNQVTWSVTDENNAPVNNVPATASVNGQAKIIGGSAVTLPATLSYTDTAVEAVTAGMTLTESGASAATELTFTDTDTAVGCETVDMQKSTHSLIQLLGERVFVKGQRYRVTITPKVGSLQAITCGGSSMLNDGSGGCGGGSPTVDVSVIENTSSSFMAIFTSPLNGEMLGQYTPWGFYDNSGPDKTVEVCVELEF